MTPVHPRVVIDTNVLLDFWVFDDPAARPLRTAVETGRVNALRSGDSVDELTQVIMREKFELADRGALRHPARLGPPRDAGRAGVRGTACLQRSARPEVPRPRVHGARGLAGHQGQGAAETGAPRRRDGLLIVAPAAACAELAEAGHDRAFARDGADGAAHPAEHWSSATSRGPAHGEVLVRVDACGVCRTDLHIVDGELPRTAPAARARPRDRRPRRRARVRASTRSRVGERVGIPWLGATCGVCPYCRAHAGEPLRRAAVHRLHARRRLRRACRRRRRLLLPPARGRSTPRTPRRCCAPA